MNTIDVLKAFYLANPEAALAFLRTQNFNENNAFITPGNNSANIAPIRLVLIESQVEAFQNLALARLNGEFPESIYEAAQLLHSCVSVLSIEQLNTLPVHWTDFWGKECAERLKVKHTFSSLETVIEGVFSGSHETNIDFNAGIEHINWITTQILKHIEPEQQKTACSRIEMVVFQKALESKKGETVIGRILCDKNNLKMINRAIQEGQLEAFLIWAKDRHDKGDFAKTRSTISTMVNKIKEALELQTINTIVKQKRKEANQSYDIIDDEIRSKEDRFNWKYLARQLTSSESKKRLTQLFEIHLECAYLTIPEEYLTPEKKAKEQAIVINKWMPLYSWLGKSWKTRAEQLPVSSNEDLVFLLTCPDTNMVNQRMKAGVQMSTSKCSEKERKKDIMKAFGHAVKNGWHPQHGFQPSVMAAIQQMPEWSLPEKLEDKYLLWRSDRDDYQREWQALRLKTAMDESTLDKEKHRARARL